MNGYIGLKKKRFMRIPVSNLTFNNNAACWNTSGIVFYKKY